MPRIAHLDPRRGLLNVHAEAIDSFMLTKRNEAHGQFDLFGGGGGDDEGGGVTVRSELAVAEVDVAAQNLSRAGRMAQRRHERDGGR